MRPLVGGVEVDVPIMAFSSGQYLFYDGTQIITAAVAGGGGDFSGPAGAVADNLVVFNGTTGKLGKDTGIPSARVVIGPLGGVTSGDVVQWAGTGGTLVSDAGFAASAVVQNQSGAVVVGNLMQFVTTTLGTRVGDSGISTVSLPTFARTQLASDSAAITTTVTTVLTLAIPSTGTWAWHLQGAGFLSTLATNTVTYRMSYSGSNAATGWQSRIETFTGTANNTYITGFTPNNGQDVTVGHANAASANFPVQGVGHIVATSTGNLTLAIARATSGAISLRAGTNIYAVKVA